MQKTLIDPFELASRTLPVPHVVAPLAPSAINARPPVPTEAEQLPTWMPRAEAWAHVRFWCSEE
jgi:hypothetical protein